MTRISTAVRAFAAAIALGLASQVHAQVSDPSFDQAIGQAWYIGSGAPTVGSGSATLSLGDSLYQSFSVTQTGDYTIAFDVSGEGRSRTFNSSTVADSSFVPVAWSGTTPTDITVWNTPTRVSYNLSAVAGESYHVYFSGYGAGMTLDNVSVSAVPEPETYAMFAAGIGALALMGRRRKTA